MKKSEVTEKTSAGDGGAAIARDAAKTQGATKAHGAEAKKRTRKAKKGARGGRIFGFVLFSVGVVALMIGGIALGITLTTGPAKRDAEYLVEAGTFAREDETGVYWHFTEVGKGYLTTDNYENVYNFIWSIKDGKLLMETAWLYQLNDEFDYSIDQEAGTMTLVREDSNTEIVYRAFDEDEVVEEVTEGECPAAGTGECNCEQGAEE